MGVREALQQRLPVRPPAHRVLERFSVEQRRDGLFAVCSTSSCRLLT